MLETCEGRVFGIPAVCGTKGSVFDFGEAGLRDCARSGCDIFWSEGCAFRSFRRGLLVGRLVRRFADRNEAEQCFRAVRVWPLNRYFGHKHKGWHGHHYRGTVTSLRQWSWKSLHRRRQGFRFRKAFLEERKEGWLAFYLAIGLNQGIAQASCLVDRSGRGRWLSGQCSAGGVF